MPGIKCAQHEGCRDRQGKQLAGENEVKEQHKDIDKDSSTIPSMLLRSSITEWFKDTNTILKET